MRLIIKNGRLIDPANEVDGSADILIEDGKVAKIGKKLSGAETVIDAAGLWVVPGLVDIHSHLREPGYEYKETIQSGTESAAAGGFTTLCCMPNTNPVNDNGSITRFILDRAEHTGCVNVFPIGAITKGSQGKELAEMGELVEAGCCAVSDDGFPVVNSRLMRSALEYSKIFDIPVIDHCEDPDLCGKGSMNEGVVSLELGLTGIPVLSEEVMIARNLLLAEYTGGRLHLAHISTVGSVRLLRDAKKRGVRVTAEACPHHFMLTEEAVRGYNTNAKVNPPLRTQEDLQAIREGLADDTIDAIATDHAPHAEDEKEAEFANAPFGMVGLETALPLSLALVELNVLTLKQLVSKLTHIPAKIMRLDKGHLSIGADADITIIDPDAQWVVKPGKLRSKSRNTPFSGWKMTGKAVTTLVGGQVVFEDKVKVV